MPATVDQIATGITVTFSGLTYDIIDVTPPSGTREKIKTTYQNSTHAHTYLPSTLVDWGEAKLKCILNDTVDCDALTTGAVGSLVITFPSGTTWTWAAAFISGFEPAGTLEELMTVDITIAVSGYPVVAV